MDAKSQYYAENRTSFERTIASIRNGGREVVSNLFMDYVQDFHPELAKHLRTVPNPNRVGLQDFYIGYIDPVTLTEAVQAIQGLLSWFNLDEKRPLTSAEMLKDGCPNDLRVDIAKCLGVIARSTLIKES